MLLTTALEALPAQLAVLRRARASLDDYVWAFFDGRVNPGRRLAVQQTVARGATPAQAIARVDAAIKDARARGLVFSLGVLETTADFPELLRRLGGDAHGVGAIASWLGEPVATGFFRLVVVSGSKTQIQLVSVASLKRAK